MFIFTRPTAERSYRSASKKERPEHSLRRIDGRRFAGTHHAIDVEQGLLTGAVLVGGQGVADIGTDIDVIDIEHRERVEADIGQHLEQFLGDFLTRFSEYLAGIGIPDDVLGEVIAR